MLLGSLVLLGTILFLSLYCILLGFVQADRREMNFGLAIADDLLAKGAAALLPQ